MKKILTLLLLIIFAISYLGANELPSRLTSSNRITYLYKNDTTSPRVLSGVAIVRFSSDSQVYNSLKHKINTINDIVKNDYKIVSFLLTSDKAVSNMPKRIAGLSAEKIKELKSLEDKLFRTAIIEFDENTNVLHFCKYIQNKDLDIELAEPYYISELLMKPNDPKIDLQEILNRISVFSAWDISQGSEDILIGISDCGVNWQHQDLKEAVAINDKEIPNDNIDNDNNGYIDDYYGYNFSWEDDGTGYGDVTSPGWHGTYVAGILGARVNNSIGIAGVSYNCRIVPIKTSPKNNYNDVMYGYQSMIYAAVRGCKVLNCSWGLPSLYSITNQLVIDYVTACDVAIVAAGGNLGSNGAGNYSSFYPAGYFGVLGVGAVGKGDVAGNVVYGPPVRIMAPSNGNWTVSGSHSYKTVSAGSSYAAPVVSGVVGLLRAAKPKLSALEALEVVRRSGDIIVGGGKNEYDSAFIPLRVNAYKALANKMEKMPSIVLADYFFTNKHTGKKCDRADGLDTLELNLVLENVLAAAKDVIINFDLIFSLDEDAYTFIEPQLVVGDMQKGECKTFKTLVIVENPNEDEAFFKAYISGKNKNNEIYTDNFKIRLETTTQVTTFYNELMTISAGDAGSIGYSTPTSLWSFGSGFSHKNIGNFIYEGGVIASSDLKKVVSVNLDVDQKKPSKNSFSVVKKLTGKNSNINIIRDDKAKSKDKIGIEVKTKYILPDDSSTAMKMLIQAKNISGKTIKDFAIGHYYDWDIGESNGRNKVEFCAECIPEDIGKDYAAVEIGYDAALTAFVGSLIYYPRTSAPDYFVLPQAAGFDNFVDDILEKPSQIEALTSGSNKQVDKVTDISYIVGLHFLDDFKAEEVRECVICSAVEATKEKLITALAKCAKSNYGNKGDIFEEVENDSIRTFIKNNSLYIQSKYNFGEIELYNLLGSKVFEAKLENFVNIFNLENINNGFYLLRINSKNNSVIKTIIYE